MFCRPCLWVFQGILVLRHNIFFGFVGAVSGKRPSLVLLMTIPCVSHDHFLVDAPCS